MTKPAVTLRNTKGSALTYSELDTNFTNLKDATVSLTAGTGGTAVSADLNGNITLVAGTGITLAGNNTAKTVTINSSGGITDIVDDTTPQLGGNLDVNGNSIVSASNGNINIIPNGTGDVVLTTDRVLLNESGVVTLEKSSATDSFVIKHSGTGGIIQLDTRSGVNLTGSTAIIRFNADASPGGGSVNGVDAFLMAAHDATVILNAPTTTITATGGATPQITFTNVSTGTPSNTSTVNGWIRIVVDGATKYIPFYA
jgi:hypothetical protein